MESATAQIGEFIHEPRIAYFSMEIAMRSEIPTYAGSLEGCLFGRLECGMKIFKNRAQAGRELADLLSDYAERKDALVLALPRGGVPVAYAVADALHLPLDVLVVRKLGVPEQPELAMGAIAAGGVVVLNTEVVDLLNEPQDVIDRAVERERMELERRERRYRGNQPALEITARTTILVDDGAATGATMRAAIQALREKHVNRVIVALPTVSTEAYRDLQAEADQIICVQIPEPFFSVGQWYREFEQTTDEEVIELLRRARQARIERN